MYKIIFSFDIGNKTTTYANYGDNLLDIAREANVSIDAPCSGNAVCGKCKVLLQSGELESPITSHISEEEYALGWRLACVSKIRSDVEVLVPDIASAYRRKMKVAVLDTSEEIAMFEKLRSDLRDAGISWENKLETVRLTMNPPTPEDTMPDLERVFRSLQEVYGIYNIDDIRIPYYVIQKMAGTLRECYFDVQCIVHKMEGKIVEKNDVDEIELLDICSLEEEPIIGGLALDIGTTSVAALLIDMSSGRILAKASAGNAQIRYGADVISRIIESTKPGGKKKLQDAIIKETLDPLIREMCHTAGIRPDRIYRVCAAGNTTMNHLFLGLDADPIRMEPYIPSFFEINNIYARDLGLEVYPNAQIIIAPNIGSYVGGDITAGTFVSGIWNKPETSLFIDLGTNGELVLGNEEFLISCACSAGPAFEGGEISCGMRATDGAIEACIIDEDTMEPTFSIINGEYDDNVACTAKKGIEKEHSQKAAGICGSGIIDLVSELFRCGIINPKGKFVREGKRIRHDEYGTGSYVLVYKEDAASIKDIEINEVDIDNFIRAKGAIFSAIRVMLSTVGFTMDMIDNVYVAGGIGSGINMKNAVNIGMFPDIPIEKFHYIGNTSLMGAYAMLLSTEAEKRVTDMARGMTYLELSSEPGYMDEFVASCFLPHTDAGLFHR